MPIETQPEAMAQRRLFDVKAAAEYLRSIGADAATVCFVRNLITSGEVPRLKMGKKFYLTKAALDGWIERHERRSRP